MWHRQQGDNSTDVFAQRVNAFGAVRWTPNGIAISVATGDQSYPQIASDDAGGAIIAWTDTRGGNLDVYAQRVSDYGVPQWTANGVALVTAANSQDGIQMAADGSGGAVVAWSDLRNGNHDVYAQRVSYAGVAQWTANGVPLCANPSEQLNPRLAPASLAGVFVAAA